MQSSPDKDGFPLPTNINPATNVCFQIEIPNDPAYLAAFFGCLYDLTIWTSWQRDPTHKGIQAAQKMKAIIAGLTLDNCTNCGASGGDDMQWRQDPDDCTKYQYSVDCVNWTTIFDIDQCVRDLIALLTGQQQGGTQPPHGSCEAWDYTLPGNGQQLLGALVSTGDTITLTNETGGCGDGTGNWYCPAGTPYFLRQCGSALSYSGSDPLTTAPHMSIIGRLGTTSPTYIAPVAGVFTIPNGHFQDQFALMVNDSDLSDNAGSYQFHAEYCALGTTGWCYKFDFATTDGSFTPASVYAGTPGTYVSGTGWEHGDFQSPAANYYRGLILDKSFSSSVVTSIVVTYDRTDGGLNAGDSSTAVAIGSSGGTLYSKSFIQAVSGTNLAILYSNPAGITLTSIELSIFSSYTGSGVFAGAVTIKSIELRGTGSNPFGSDNC